MLIDLVFKMGKSYYPQTFLEQLKCKIKEEKTSTFITHDVQISLSDDDNSEDDSE